MKDPRLDARVDKFYGSAMTRLAKVTDKDFIKYIQRKMVAWYRRFPPTNDPDRMEKTQEGDDGMGAGAADDSDQDAGEGAALQLSDDEATDPEVPT